MANVLRNAFETYSGHLELIAFSAISLVLAFLIPAISPFPTFLDLGSEFVRTASVFSNLTAVDLVIIIVSTMFSILFLSFAIVMVNITIKYRKTRVKIGSEVIRALEKYTGNVFIILFLFTFILMAVDIVSYSFVGSTAGLITAIAGLLLTPFFFYAPSSIVIDEKKVRHSLGASFSFISKRFGYLLLWLIVAIAFLTASDLLFMPLGPQLSGYVLLFVDSILILPFLLILQGEMYINRYDMLRG